MPAAIACRTALAAVAVCASLASTARADTVATITPSISPDRGGAGAMLTFTIHYAGGEFGVPSPLRHSILRFPAGMTLELPKLRTCSPTRLRSRGAGGCPAQSLLGRGRALAEVRVGSQLLTEHVALWAFLGPPQNLQPTLEVLSQGYTPFDERVLLTGKELSAPAPYGEELVLDIPPIPTLPLEPDASIVSLSLTIGERSHQPGANTVVVPRDCPAGGFPFAAQFTYADGSSGSALAKAPCPGATRADEHLANAARTLTLDETGHLHATSKHDLTLNEQGSAAGTVTGTIYVHLTVVSSSRVTAEVNIYPSGGSISGYASASYNRGSQTATFAGSLSITRGTGNYAHAHGPGLSFSGTIQHTNDAVTVHVRGRVSD